jgi:hypothetical protein
MPLFLVCYCSQCLAKQPTLLICNPRAKMFHVGLDMYYFWISLTVLFGSGNCLPPSKTRILSWQGSVLSGGYRAVANYIRSPYYSIEDSLQARFHPQWRLQNSCKLYKITIIQYGGISSSKAPSSMEATEQLQII